MACTTENLHTTFQDNKPAETNSTEKSKRLRSVLIVDDAPEIVGSLQKGLAQQFSLIEIASDTDAADALLSRCHFDLIILDIRLPNGSGVEWVSGLRDQDYMAPVIFMATHGDMQTATAGTSNFVLGVNAGNSIASGGNYNVAIGDEAGTALTTGDSNIAIGYAALAANTTGTGGVACGRSALAANTTGNYNNAVGQSCLGVNTTGTQNSAMGYLALGANTTGANNVVIGHSAGVATTTGAQNVMVGTLAGQTLTTGTYNVYIGYNNNPSAVGVSGEIVIAHANQVGKGTNTGFINPNGGGVYQGNNSTAWSQTSDRRIKKDIVPNTKGLAAINQIEPMNFYYKSDEELQEELPGAKEDLPLNKRTTSAIAQELDLIFPEAIERRGEHDIMSVNTDPIFWSMVNAIKELSAKVTELEEKLNG